MSGPRGTKLHSQKGGGKPTNALLDTCQGHGVWMDRGVCRCVSFLAMDSRRTNRWLRVTASDGGHVYIQGARVSVTPLPQCSLGALRGFQGVSVRELRRTGEDGRQTYSRDPSRSPHWGRSCTPRRASLWPSSEPEGLRARRANGESSEPSPRQDQGPSTQISSFPIVGL